MNQLVTGKFIALKRKQKNLTQEQLAEKLGVSNKTISKWETGKCMPDYSIVKSLCEELTSMKEVPEQLRKLRRQYLRYQQAEIIYSISHKKLFELASDAGAIYRIDGTVLINRDIFDDYLERFHEPATGNDKEKKTDER